MPERKQAMRFHRTGAVQFRRAPAGETPADGLQDCIVKRDLMASGKTEARDIDCTVRRGLGVEP